MQLNNLMAPKSIALLGASNKEGSLGYSMMDMIIRGGFSGEIYPVHPKNKEVFGMKCYSSLEEIGKEVDLVVLSLAAKRIEAQVDLAIQAKAKALVIFANCVLESEESPTLEEKIVKKCQDAGIPLMGHNAMGFYNNDLDLRVCGFDAPDEGIKGSISFISQSGSVFSTLGHNEPQLKFNMMVATGTGHITGLSDYILHALEQPTTKVVGIYLESIRHPERFIKALKKAAEKNIPIVAMKVGKSKLGAEFAKSHTGGLAGDDDVIQAVFDHYGVIRVYDLDEMANTLLLFSSFDTIPKGGLAAISDSGGERNMLADIAEEINLEYANLSTETLETLQRIQEPGQEAANPLDPWGTGIDFEKIFGESLGIMMSDSNSAIGMISQDLRTGYFLTEGCLEAMHIAKTKTSKPLIFLTNFGGSRRSEITAALNSIGIPVLVGTRPGLRAVKSVLEYSSFTFKEAAPSFHSFNIENTTGKNVLLEHESLDFLKKFGIPVIESRVISSLNELKHLDLDFPLVLKTAEEGILHKSDVDGVILNIKSMDELKSVYQEVSGRLGPKVLIAPMLSYDHEFILGMKNDPIFGPVVLVGAGGILTEVLNDKIILLPESTTEEIQAKFEKLKTYKLLTGYRNMKAVNTANMIETIKKFCEVSKILKDHVSEIDINPLIIKGDLVRALDALIVLK